MPDLAIHEKIAENNQAVIDNLLKESEGGFQAFAPWVVTVAFYKALHLVECILYVDGQLDRRKPLHSQNHTERNDTLRQRKYAKLWKHYYALYNASMTARYLTDAGNGGVEQYFKQYFGSVDKIRSMMLNHHLRQIEHIFEDRKKRLAGES